MAGEGKVNRRAFLGAVGGALTVLPRHVLGGAGRVPPSERIAVGYVGAGTQGIRQLMDALKRPELRIAAVCDPNRRSDDYVEWYKDELRDKIRAFLGDPSWADDAAGCRCGREIGRELVERHYARQGEKVRCPAYGDFRAMLDAEADLDAVYIMTPDHLHATVAVHAMRRGKHVITHKPIGNVFHEMAVAVETARATGKVAQLFCAAAKPTTPLLSEWIRAGAIGAVREVHNWSTRPFWPQGMTALPRQRPPVPAGLDWDLWLGPVPHRPYHPAYTHAVFRGWYDFGTGALGDMGHYSFFQIFRILELGSPASVEAGRSQYWEIVGGTWAKQENRVSYPRASTIRWEFPARKGMPPLSLEWYDGGLRPPTPRELEEDGRALPAEGLLFVGERGKILAGFSGDDPHLIPAQRMRAFRKPPATLPRPIPELDQWIRACRGGPPPEAAFARAYPFSEAILLGTIALRVPGKLRWDGAARRFTNAPEADALLRRAAYRPGWAL